MSVSVDFGTRPSSVEELPTTRNESGGKLVEEAFDYFTCMEIGKSIEQKAAKTKKIDEETLSNEIIGQFSKLQAPKGNVKFGDKEIVIFNEDERIGHSMKANSSVDNVILPLPILKISQKGASDIKYMEPDNKMATQQERLFEVFRRCYTLCNLPMSQFDENNPFKSLKKLCEGIKKSFKAKDECYKYIRYEENRRLSQEIRKLKDTIQELKDDRHNSLVLLQINKLQKHNNEYRNEIKDLTAQVTSTNYENSELRSNISELQTTKNQLMEKLGTALARSVELENNQEEKIELTKQNTKLNNDHGKLNDEHERLTKKYESLEEEYTKVTHSNESLTAKVDALTTTVQGWTHDHSELKSAHDILKSINKDLNSKLSKESTNVGELEAENSKLQRDSQDSKIAFKTKLQELIDENIDLKSQVEKWRVEFEQVQTKYDKLNLEQREIVKQREKFRRDSDQTFKKTVELQLQLDQHVKYREQAIKFNAEREACLITLKKLDFEYCHLQKSFEQACVHNRELLEFQQAAERVVQDMNSKIVNLEKSKKTDAFKIDTLTRQVLKQTDKLDELQLQLTSWKQRQRLNGRKASGKRDILRSLANTKTLLEDPMTLSKNVC
ncbi:ZYRO0E04708p [Zygosaccharomyces rouxii]|uniref:ZYRO0E04708p n=2 Tax=Zygosaccharomyces rouxii TaxID=4956 RepID=C5E4C1_ZYGRC|nr:uncharacterized protein ZYRO0E04708g [Zygosaccharomyces rouxii]KAH9198260.1 intracellular protein transport protein USO1 [Zygosaccharomyces rouxii]CAQ43437.1 Intracellular protein transport protein USO1 [Zygosaccharomyces rouxii]CAR30882.1 ZYRO0E04708p [Zygosaccharomyces rouxii]